jgi:uncharacterized membrane protein
MNEKTFSTIRKIMIVVIGAVVAISIIFESLIISFAVVLFGITVMVALKHKVDKKIEDERIFKIAQKASMRTVQIFGFLMAMISVSILILREAYDNFELIGSVLAYSTCGFLMIYGIFYSYYSRKLGG